MSRLGASTSRSNPLASSSSRKVDEGTDLWADILKSANRGGRGRTNYKRKNIVLLSERHRGRSYLLSQLSRKGNTQAQASSSFSKGQKSLAVGYEILETKEDGDEESVPPVSIFYPPDSHPTLLNLLPKSLPPNSLLDTAVVILLDWSKPSNMIRELLVWLHWVEKWVEGSSEQHQRDEMREKLQSHIQHYSEPNMNSANNISTSLSTYNGGPLLPLGPGSLTLNHAGIPIVVVCSRADLMDVTGEEAGMKGQWEERTDWIQQVLRTVCLAYGAALFYTAPTQPSTYTLLRQYLFHRLYTTPPPTNPSSDAPIPSSPFPFSHRANVLDRDAVMVPPGWDSHGKINVLRERFEPPRVLKAWESSLRSMEGENGDEETIEDMWMAMIPDTSRPKALAATTTQTTAEPEQTFLSRQLEILQKDPNRDPRASFRQAAAAVSATASSSSAGQGSGSSNPDTNLITSAGVVGPMGAGGLSLPGVEKVMAEMEGGSAEDMKEKFARLGRRETTMGRSNGPLSPTTESTPKGAVPNEALHNFFQGLLATKGKSATSKSPSTTPAPKPPVKE